MSSLGVGRALLGPFLPAGQTLAQAITEGAECECCMEPIAAEADAELEPCGHFFHRACVAQVAVCPSCRLDLGRPAVPAADAVVDALVSAIGAGTLRTADFSSRTLTDAQQGRLLHGIATVSALRAEVPLDSIKLEDATLEGESPEFLVYALAAHPTVSSLDLRGLNVAFTADMFVALLASGSISTIKLEHHRGAFGAPCFQAIASGLRVNSTLRSIAVAYGDCDEAGAAAIADALRVNTALRRLALVACGLTARGAAAFADALSANRSLALLNLAANDLGAAGVCALAAALQHSTLVALNPGDNVGGASADALAAALRASPATLQRLTICQPENGDTVARALAPALRVNTTLRILSIGSDGGEEVSDAGADALARALRANRTLQELKLKHSSITREGRERLRAAWTSDATRAVSGELSF